MKYIVLSILFLTSMSFINTESKKIKNAEIIYKISFYKLKETKESTDKIEDEYTRKQAELILNSLKEAMDKVEYSLLFNQQQSLFTSVDKVENDMGFQLAKDLFGGDALFYKNLKTKEKIHQVNREGQLFNIVSDIDEFEWIITDETKKIGDYTCYKATTQFTEENKLKGTTSTFNPEVWFTPEIPVPFGPKGLDGLPGLILQASMGNNIYIYASTINLKSKNKKNKIAIEKGGKELTKTEYLDMIYEETKSRMNN